MHAEAMIRSHPALNGHIDAALLRCVEECLDCAQTCTSCADACLGESNVGDLRQCIRLNLDCADLCTVTAALASRRTGSNDAVLRAAILVCRDACQACGAECGRHASMHEHCRVCADACRRCEAACAAAADGIRPSLQ
ncbi:four-helix bundle copper-binding protein [Pleomorphomonas oryzae]|uniref:four-helix bundle copper-binding protein n=1 Tax=Pleomorphomonas oryzae TaxID=261934 RepID=UPI00041C64FF|nr:four-helix bundle copper-binding protein [Pleomorphomonas oryzae]